MVDHPFRLRKNDSQEPTAAMGGKEPALQGALSSLEHDQPPNEHLPQVVGKTLA
jgi:hypothetical protein